MTKNELKKIISYVNDEIRLGISDECSEINDRIEKGFFSEEEFINKYVVEIQCGEYANDNIDDAVVTAEKNLSVENSDVIFVDLGLPSGTLWMDRNIGAKSETDLGLHFYLGETVGHEKNPKIKRTELSNIWNSNGTLKIDKDAAYAYTDGMAVIPTKKQCQELMDNAYVVWWENFKNSGVEGAQIISKVNNNYIFIPDCDYAGGVAIGTKNTDKDAIKYEYCGYDFSQLSGSSWNYSDGSCYIGNACSFKQLLVRGVKK